MPDHTLHSNPSLHPTHSGLIWIGCLKLCKSLLFLSIGIGALHMLHRDLADEILDAASVLRFDPESHFVSVVLDQTAVLSDARLREISLGTFFYAALAMMEAIGLILQKEWAEYFTLILTASFLPFEGYEIYLHATLWKCLLITVNVLIVLYLLLVVWENRRDVSV
jgi:uncharacterized membrane protein (DUF2068 family)